MNEIIYISENSTKDKSGIYIIRNNINDKIYIGSGLHLGNRCNVHRHKFKKNKHSSASFQNFYNKYSDVILYFEVIELVENREDLISREQHYLDKYKSYDKNIGYNICKTAGSTLGRRGTPESIAKMKATWEKMGGHPALGHIPKHKGIPLSLETKAKISAKLSGEKNPMYGVKHTPEIVNFLVKKSSKPVDLVDKDGNIIESFVNAVEASKKLGAHKSAITKVCSGYSSHAKGLLFRYSKLTYDEVIAINKSKTI